MRLDFSDKSVNYRTFVSDLAARIARLLRADRDDPEFMSTRQAYKAFGRRNVERWRDEGKLHPRKRPGKVEYETAELRLLQRTDHDYLAP